MDWKTKLSSRKLWAAIAGVVMGVAMVFGLDESTIATVSGAVTSLISIIIYIITEGKVDAAAVTQAYTDTATIIEAVKDALNNPEDTKKAAPVTEAVQ